jgi:hypothetical protein
MVAGDVIWRIDGAKTSEKVYPRDDALLTYMLTHEYEYE